MSATKYQVLYRYINEATNTVITNDDNLKYDAVCEFYVNTKNGGHKIFEEKYQLEATQQQQEMISYGNSVENTKNNMLFAYDGTKKIYYKKWVDETPAYIIKDWTLLKREEIGNLGDYTKKFTTINAETPENGGTVLCSAKVAEQMYKDVFTQTGFKFDAKTGYNYTQKEFNDFITENVNLVLNCSPDDYKYTFKPNTTNIHYKTYNDIENVGADIYANTNKANEKEIIRDIQSATIAPSTSNIFINKNIQTYYLWQSYYYYGYYYKKLEQINNGILSSEANTGAYKPTIIIKSEHLETAIIPGHYEEQSDAPYLIIDTYKKIKLSPWFVNCQCSSLETAITKAKLLTEIIGIDNVKVIKLVPIDQKIKIR
jgi:hypothetical protein